MARLADGRGTVRKPNTYQQSDDDPRRASVQGWKRMTEKRVLIIGAGAAGLSAATELATAGIRVDVIDKAPFAGGHAVQFACKATEACVKCGACVIEEKLKTAVSSERVRLYAGCQVMSIARNNGIRVETRQAPLYIDPEKCTGCGDCLAKCPVEGAVLQGTSSHHIPLFAISEEKCLNSTGKSCRLCSEACAHGAINLEAEPKERTIRPQAVILATGFRAYDPADKPYGYGILENVVTNLDLEKILRREGSPLRPTDGRLPGSMAFIQCVGSRDIKRNHLWCSTVCCGSSLRMARKIKHAHKEIDITIFYIDIQNFGKDFESVYGESRNQFRFLRSIPGDIYPHDDDTLRVTSFDEQTGIVADSVFDLVVLSVGIVPREDSAELAREFGLEVRDSGFIGRDGQTAGSAAAGIFPAGAVTQPMSIAEAVADGSGAAFKALTYVAGR